MHIDRFLQRAPSYLDEGIAIHLIGSSGIGKSDAVRQLRDDLSRRDGFEWGLSTQLLATLTPPDINGFLMGVTREVPDAAGKKKQQLMSEFSMPPWCISDTGVPMNSYKRGIVFMDERDKADPDTKKAAAEVILHRRAGRHQLHDGIGMVSASNSREHRSGSTREYDFIINREAQWSLKPHLGSWLAWAYRAGIDPLFTTYAERHPDVVFADQHPEQQGPWCTPRSFVRFCQILKRDYMKAGLLNVEGAREEILEEGAGMIGVAAIEDMLTWIKVQTEVPTIDQIVAGPQHALVPALPDALLLVTYMAAHGIAKKNAEQVVDYVLRLPPEFHLTFATAAIRRDRTLAAVPALTKRLAARNANMINMLAAL